MTNPTDIYSLIYSIATLAVGAGGIKIFDHFFRGRREDKKDRQDGWQFAIQTLKNDLDEERKQAKEHAIKTDQQVNEIKLELADTKRELVYTKSKMQLMEVSMVKAGLIEEIDKINQVLDERDGKIDQISKKISKLKK